MALEYSGLSPGMKKKRREKLARGEVTAKNKGGKNLERPKPPGMPPIVPKLAGGHSKPIPNISSKVELKEGFHVAQEKIEVGDVLVVEAPTFTAPCPPVEHGLTNQCSHCLDQWKWIPDGLQRLCSWHLSPLDSDDTKVAIDHLGMSNISPAIGPVDGLVSFCICAPINLK